MFSVTIAQEGDPVISANDSSRIAKGGVWDGQFSFCPITNEAQPIRNVTAKVKPEVKTTGARAAVCIWQETHAGGIMTRDIETILSVTAAMLALRANPGTPNGAGGDMPPQNSRYSQCQNRSIGRRFCVKQERLSEEKIVSILGEQGEKPIAHLCREHGIAEQDLFPLPAQVRRTEHKRRAAPEGTGALSKSVNIVSVIKRSPTSLA
jgi:hypothetical protein